MSDKVTRRKFVKGVAVAVGGAALAACTPQIVKETVIVEKAVEKVVKETVVVEKAVQETVVVEKVVTRAASKMIGEITVALPESASPIHPYSPAHLASAEATGINLRFVLTPSSDYSAKVGIWMATGQVPDIMQANRPYIEGLADPSVLQPLMPLIDQYGPNLKKYLQAHPAVARLTIDGKLYQIPRLYYHFWRFGAMPMVRQDLLEKTGLPAPEDFDQLYEVLKAIKKDNPDSVGWTCRGGLKRALSIYAYPFGSGLGGFYRGRDAPYWEEEVEGGKWLYGPIYPEFRPVLAYFAKLYKEGLLDPDVATSTTQQWAEKNSTGQGVFSWDNMSFAVAWNAALGENDPNAFFRVLPTISGQRGARQNEFGTLRESFCISANLKNPEWAIKVLEWQLTPVGLDTVNWGIEGIHYQLTEPRPDRIDDYSTENVDKVMREGGRELLPHVWEEYSQKADSFRAFQSDTGTGRLDFSTLMDSTVNRLWLEAGGEDIRAYDTVRNDPGMHSEVIVPPLTSAEAERYKNIMTDVNVIMDPILDQVILGQAPLSDYDKAVEQAVQAGAADLEKIYNEAEGRVEQITDEFWTTG